MQNAHIPESELRALIAETGRHLQRIADNMSSVMGRTPNPKILTSLAEAHSFIKQSVSILRDAEKKLMSAGG